MAPQACLAFKDWDSARVSKGSTACTSVPNMHLLARGISQGAPDGYNTVNVHVSEHGKRVGVTGIIRSMMHGLAAETNM